MNIVVDIRSLLSPYQTGVGEFTSGLLQGLQVHTDHTYQYYYNAAKAVQLPQYITESKQVFHTAYPNRLMTVFAPLANMPKVESFARDNVDLIYTPNIQYLPHHASTPYILTIHDLSFIHMPEYLTKKQRAWHSVQRLQYQVSRASAIVVPSESTKTDVVHTLGITEDRVHVVYPGLNPAACETVSEELALLVQQTYSLKKPYILYLGTIEPRKNIDTLIEAYQAGQFWKEGIELIIAGASGWNTARTFTAIEATPGVRYIGYVEAAHKAALYAGTQCFVYPSVFEGFGFPVLEAMAQGVPVVTTHRTSLPEITSGSVQYTDPYRVDQLVSAMKEALQSTHTDELMRIANTYTWQRAATELDSIFKMYGKQK